MWVSTSQCKRLFDYDNSLRFGVAYLPGQGISVALIRLVSPGEVFNPDPTKRKSLSFTWDMVPNRLHIQGPKGGLAELNDRIPVIESWPSQSWGLNAIMKGDYVDALIYQLKPGFVYDTERKDALRAKGRAMDDLVAEQGEEAMDYHKFLGRDGANSDRLYDKEDIKRDSKNPLVQEFLRARDGDKSLSFEEMFVKDAGLS